MTEQLNSTCFCVFVVCVTAFGPEEKKKKSKGLNNSFFLSATSLTPQPHTFPQYYLFVNNCRAVLVMWKHVKVYSYVTENNLEKNLFKICLVLSILTSISLFASRTHAHTRWGNPGQPCAVPQYERKIPSGTGSPVWLHPSPHPGMITRMGNRALDFLQHVHLVMPAYSQTYKAVPMFGAMHSALQEPLNYSL